MIKAWFVDWPVWWAELSWKRRWLPLGLIAAYWASLALLGGLRGDHINLGMAMLVLSYAGRAFMPAARFLFPVFMTGVIYDSQRFYSDYIRGPVHVTEPYNFDKMFFGISTAQGVLTPNEWWQLHTHWSLDLITGFAYLVFFALFVVIAAWFQFQVAKRGTAKLAPEAIGERGKAPIWAFLWLNLLGYSTYYWYAAAPPWYVSKYGLGPANMDAAASQAGCVRFDELLGTHFFSEMYGRSADVFGAIPSLHIAYPLLAVYFAFRFGTLRVFCSLFYLVMCFSAVYLNHHYMLDIIWGSAYALAIGYVTDRVYMRRMAPVLSGGGAAAASGEFGGRRRLGAIPQGALAASREARAPGPGRSAFAQSQERE